MKLKPSQNAIILAIGIYAAEIAYIALKELYSNHLSIYLWLAGMALILSITLCIMYHEFVEKPEEKVEAVKAEGTGA